MMVRMQIQLTEEQHERLRRLSAETGKSLSALIRDAIDRLPDGAALNERWERAWSVVGKYRGDGADMAEEHDRYLDGAYGEH
jgi:Arc/MetJ-type ribon-helix-helix transcriptional regulator